MSSQARRIAMLVLSALSFTPCATAAATNYQLAITNRVSQLITTGTATSDQLAAGKAYGLNITSYYPSLLISRTPGAAGTVRSGPTTSTTGLWTDLELPTTGDRQKAAYPSGDPKVKIETFCGNQLEANVQVSFDRLKAMALAYSAQGSKYYQDAALELAIVNGTRWLLQQVYVYDSSYITGKGTSTTWGNWYGWEIGMPSDINDIMDLLYPSFAPYELDISQYAASLYSFSYSAGTTPVYYTGANEMWHDNVLAMAAVLSKESSYLVSTYTTDAPNSFTVQGGDGLYADYSYIQHSYIPYNGGYGIAHINEYLNTVNIYAGTGADVSSTIPFGSGSPTPTTSIYKILMNAVYPLIYKGEFMDDVRGREISRFYESSHASGIGAMTAFLHGIAATTGTQQTTLQQTLKYWLTVDTTLPYDNNTGTLLANFSIPDMPAISALISSSVTAIAQPAFFRSYSVMDRMVAQRPMWAASVSMFSTRTQNYEADNGEDQHGWNTNNGMLYLYDDDITQHSDNYWPTIDAHRLDATTVEQYYETAPNQFTNQSVAVSGGKDVITKGTSSIVGGVVSYTDYYGVAAMAVGGTFTPALVTNPPGTLEALSAHKAWFVLDDQIVNLGSGITSNDTPTVETILANRMLTSSTTSLGANTGSGTDTVTYSDGTTDTSTPISEPPAASADGTYGTTAAQSFMHIADARATNAGTGAGVGYYFPTPLAIRDVREARSATWSSLQASSSTDYAGVPTQCQPPTIAAASDPSYTRNFFTAMWNHGAGPSNNTYSYAVFPNTTVAAMASYQKAPTVTVLSNTTSVQAISDTKSGVEAAVFWSAAGGTVGTPSTSNYINVNVPAVVLLQVNDGGKVELEVSDPTQVLTGTITVTLGIPVGDVYYTSTSNGTSLVKVVSTKPLSVQITPSSIPGQTVKAQFATY